MVKKVDKNKATTLKEQGKTYIEIAAELGCSVVWCKKNLKDTVKNKEGKEMLQKYIDLAKSSTGITSGQIRKMLKQDHEGTLTGMDDKQANEFLEVEVAKVKRKLQDEDCIVRPHWMSPKHSNRSLRRMLELVDDFDSRLYEMLEEFKADMEEITGEKTEYIDLSAISTLLNISQLGVQKYGSSRIAGMCQNLADTASKLERRNGKQASKGSLDLRAIFNNSNDFSDLEECMY